MGSQGGVSRFTFDALHNATDNGLFSAPQGVGGLAFATSVPEASPVALLTIVGLSMMVITWRDGGKMRRKKWTTERQTSPPPRRYANASSPRPISPAAIVVMAAD